jgi:hypothetical protein
VANRGVADVDFTTPVGEVRLLIGDTDVKDGSQDATDGTGEFVFFGDTEIQAFIRLHGGSRQAAAAILRAIAASTALKLKKWSSADLAVDGPAIANSLLKAADALEAGANADIAAASADFTKVVPVGGHSKAADLARADGALWPFGLI